MVRTVERENSNEGNDVDTVVMPFCGSFLFLYIFFFFLFFLLKEGSLIITTLILLRACADVLWEELTSEPMSQLESLSHHKIYILC